MVKKETSYVGITLTYVGDPFKFREILIDMKDEAEMDGMTFDCSRITTYTEGE